METNWILPRDLLVDIVSRLPVRDLLRLRCVCKEWCAFIDDDSFIKKSYEVRYSICKEDGNMRYLITKYKLGRSNKVLLLSIHQGETITLNLNADLERDSTDVLPHWADQFYVSCHGCVNGVICLSFEYKETPKIDKCFLALWNPATREFKTVVYPNVPELFFARCFGILGFGFDLLSNDFKILGVCDDETGIGKFRYELYSVKTNSWKTIPDPNVLWLPSASTNAYLNGVYYMTTDDQQSVGRASNFEIVSFNFASEVFKVSEMPQEAVSLVYLGKSYQVMLALYKDQLGLFVSHVVEEVALCNIDIWIVTQFDDCGVPLSWQHLYTIYSGTLDKLGLEVQSILINGDLVLLFFIPDIDRTHEGDVACTWYSGLYNHSRCEFKKLEIDLKACFRYVESLFLLS